MTFTTPPTRYATDLSTGLLSAGGETTLTVSSITLPSGEALDFDKIGDRLYLVINPGGSNEEFVYVTGRTGTTFSGLIRGLSYQGDPTASSARAKAHSAGEQVVATNYGGWFGSQYVSVDDTQTIVGPKTFSGLITANAGITLAASQTIDMTSSGVITGLALPTSGQLTRAASVEYVNNAANAGAADASTVGKGLVEVALDSELAAGKEDATGNTTAPLVARASAHASTNIDQSQTTQDATTKVGEANATGKQNKLAQSFVAARSNMTGVYLYKSADTGSFTGTVTVALQADSAGSPSGSNLASVTITNASYLAFAVGRFLATFGTAYSSLVSGTTYWLVISTSTSDNSNHPNLGTASAGGYASGSAKYNNTTDGWVAIATIDLYFKTVSTLVNKVPVTQSNQTLDPLFTTQPFTTGEAYAVNDALYLKASDGKVYRADSDATESTYRFIGFAAEDSSGTGLTRLVYTQGVVPNFIGLTTGLSYYIGSTSGALATTPGTYSKRAGFATSTTSLMILPNRAVVSGSGTRADNTVTGDTVVTVGFRPQLIEFTSWRRRDTSTDAMTIAYGTALVNPGTSMYFLDGSGAPVTEGSYVSHLFGSTNSDIRTSISAFSETGFTITWGATPNDGAGNITYFWIAYE